MVYQLRDYQRDAHNFAVQSLLDRDAAGLLLDMGLGKTGVTLRVLDTLKLVADSPIESVLITAPSRVVDHWPAERRAWNTSLPVRVLTGLPHQRETMLNSPFSGITVISHDLLLWLTEDENLKKVKPDVFIIDEGSKFRDWSSKRTAAALKLALRAKYRMVLTGTPCPEGDQEIFAQQAMLDLGKTLGKKIGEFRDKFCYRGGYENRTWLFDTQKRDKLQELIAPYYLRQSAEDYLDLPPEVEQTIKVHLPPAVKAEYEKLREELIAELTTGTLIALNGSDRYRLSRMLASGVVYDQNKPGTYEYNVVHKAKLDAVVDMVEEIDGQVMIAYQYICEREELLKALAKYKPVVIAGGKYSGRKKTSEAIDAFTKGTTKILLAQNNAASHGIDKLQTACHNLLWFTLPDSGDAFNQLRGRLQRTGQTKTVVVHYLQSIGTIDSAMLYMQKNKQFSQEALLEGLKGDETT